MSWACWTDRTGCSCPPTEPSLECWACVHAVVKVWETRSTFTAGQQHCFAGHRRGAAGFGDGAGRGEGGVLL